MVKLDISKYLSKGELSLEKLNLENCLITDIDCEYLTISNCNFNNIIFKNSFRSVNIAVEDCCFVDCEFQDSFEGSELEFSLSDCEFNSCAFVNIVFDALAMQSEVTKCELKNCIFKNINIDGDISICGLKLKGGELKHVKFCGNQLLRNSLLDVKMENVNIYGCMVKNSLENITFEDTVIKGYFDNNSLTNCSKQGITFIDKPF